MISRHVRPAFVAALGAAALAACTEPAVAPKPPAVQQSASNVRDWDAAAIRMVRSMAVQGFIPTPAPPPAGRVPFPPPYYINVLAQGSTFLEEVRQSMEKELLYRGLPIARTPIGATVINLDVDYVQWGAGATYPGGVLTALGIGGLVGTAIAAGGSPSATAAGGIAAGAAAAADIGLAIVPQSRTELVWRASIVSGDRVVMKGSEILYVSAADVPLYVGSGVQPPPLASPGVPVLGPDRPLVYAR
jgi:hypothetical protein